MKTFFKWLVVGLVIILAAFSFVHILMTMVIADLEQYQAESACVMEYVRVGIERADIATGDGTCWLK